MTKQQQQEILARCEDETVKSIAKSMGISYRRVYGYICRKGFDPLVTEIPAPPEQTGEFFDVDIYLQQTQTI
jgi:hypothetical protein